MSERDVENLFLETGFYRSLGYEGTGVDIRSEYTLPDDRRPDFVTLDNNEDVIAVYEFKTSGRDLPEHEDQLFHYMDELRSDYGVLTNGEELRVYQRGDTRPTRTLSTVSITEQQARDLASNLEKRELDLSKSEDVKRFREELDPIPLDERADLGQENFFDTFRLEEGSPFADLVTGMMDLLHELRDEQEAKFVIGAYDFWEATYADEPDEVPSSWEQFVDGKQSLRDFMFCLESGHALLSRLLLAKATEDHGFFEGTGYNGVDDYFRELRGFGEDINLDAFPVAASNLIDDMRDKLVEGLFQDDIFIWWKDGYKEEIKRQHKNRTNQFNAVAKGLGSEGGISRVSKGTRDRMSRAVAEVFANILRFDFTNVQGDLLGNLYQRYFDPETRKALGEFYTPQPVVDYIMDGVGYDRGVSNERLIDPACGSGTFLVDAVERYLDDVERYHDDPDWESHLRELCTQPHIVGLDIHPFAVLMAQIRFVVAILPAYREAKIAADRRGVDFTLRRLPIYRTDTLRNERELTGVDIGDDGSRQMTLNAMTEDEQDVLIPVPLPVEVDENEDAETEDGFLVRRVRMPLFDTIQLETGVNNFGEYFAALQGVLDTVKDHMKLAEEFGKDFNWTYQSGLEERVNEYTSQEYSGVEDFFEPYVNDMLENVRYLQEEHNDGRLFKMFEDTVLALVVKNYIEYDYVVGNPPYVNIQNIRDSQKELISTLYDTAVGQFDLYCPFYERGLEWLEEDNGTLGYITPNQFMVTDYGENTRKVIFEETAILDICDFRDSGVFEDATNYPAVVIVEDEPNEAKRDATTIRCTRVRADTQQKDERELDEAVIDAVREHKDDPGYSDDLIDVFDYSQSQLGTDYWALMPPREQEIFDKLERKGDKRMENVTEAIFPGPTTGSNKIYVVEVVDADQILSDDSGDTVTVIPSGGSKEYEIETDLLRPWLSGSDVQRWRCEWSGNHVILPYTSLNEGSRDDQLLTKDELVEDYPLTWDYFKAHEDDLRSRQSGRWEDSDKWWEFAYPRNLERFERPKTVFAHITDEPAFMLDKKGTWYFKTAYAALLNEDWQHLTEEIASQLNSAPLEYYFKHVSTVKASGFYEYRAQYVNPIPCITEDETGGFETMRDRADEIVDNIDLDSRTDRFPEAYLGEYDGQIDYITYEWQTRRYPISAEVQGGVDGDFTVQAGNTDTITDPAMYSDTHEARKKRAEYVCTAVNGRNAKSGGEMTIPIPQSDDGVEELLTRLEEDKREVEETDIDKLEAEIDEAIYDLFDLTDDEQEVIEEYLEVF
jgi:type I restriction-modification system DNA methylase subunit